MKVTLTFDNGPHPDVTPHVRQVLRAHGLHAHFFVVGEMVRKHGDELAATLDEGHRIGNHSNTHSTPLGLIPGPQGVAEVALADEIIGKYCGDARAFRPFGGRGAVGPHLLSPSVWDYLSRNGYSCVLWNCLAYEWEDINGWVEPTLERCRSRPHSVVVLHDLPSGAMLHLDRFIRSLRSEGAEFTLDFPFDCLPLSKGKAAWSSSALAGIVAHQSVVTQHVQETPE